MNNKTNKHIKQLSVEERSTKKEGKTAYSCLKKSSYGSLTFFCSQYSPDFNGFTLYSKTRASNGFYLKYVREPFILLKYLNINTIGFRGGEVGTKGDCFARGTKVLPPTKCGPPLAVKAARRGRGPLRKGKSPVLSPSKVYASPPGTPTVGISCPLWGSLWWGKAQVGAKYALPFRYPLPTYGGYIVPPVGKPLGLWWGRHQKGPSRGISPTEGGGDKGPGGPRPGEEKTLKTKNNPIHNQKPLDRARTRCPLVGKAKPFYASPVFFFSHLLLGNLVLSALRDKRKNKVTNFNPFFCPVRVPPDFSFFKSPLPFRVPYEVLYGRSPYPRGGPLRVPFFCSMAYILQKPYTAQPVRSIISPTEGGGDTPKGEISYGDKGPVHPFREALSWSSKKCASLKGSIISYGDFPLLSPKGEIDPPTGLPHQGGISPTFGGGDKGPVLALCACIISRGDDTIISVGDKGPVHPFREAHFLEDQESAGFPLGKRFLGGPRNAEGGPRRGISPTFGGGDLPLRGPLRESMRYLGGQIKNFYKKHNTFFVLIKFLLRAHKDKLKKIIKKSGKTPVAVLITKLNREIRNWLYLISSTLFLSVKFTTKGDNKAHSKIEIGGNFFLARKKAYHPDVLSKMNLFIYKLLWLWAKKRHNKRSNRWIFEKYWKFIDNQPSFYTVDAFFTYNVISYLCGWAFGPLVGKAQRWAFPTKGRPKGPKALKYISTPRGGPTGGIIFHIRTKGSIV